MLRQLPVSFPSASKNPQMKSIGVLDEESKTSRNPDYCLLNKRPAVKRCSRCRQEKTARAFAKSTREASGFQSWCKNCLMEYSRNRPKVYVPTVLEKDCSTCGMVKKAEEFCKDVHKPTGLRSQCRDCRRKIRATRKEQNKTVKRRKKEKQDFNKKLEKEQSRDEMDSCEATQQTVDFCKEAPTHESVVCNDCASADSVQEQSERQSSQMSVSNVKDRALLMHQLECSSSTLSEFATADQQSRSLRCWALLTAVDLAISLTPSTT